MTPAKEIERLAIRGSAPPSGLRSEIFVDCPSNSHDVLEKTVSVLKKVLESPVPVEGPVDEWGRILPPWFVKACFPEIDPDDAHRDPSVLREFERSPDAWMLSGFLYWFTAENRSWYWWSAEVQDQNRFKIVLLVQGWPFPWDALDFLLKTAGASRVETID